MPWDWNQVLQTIPPEKRIRIESLHIQADMLGSLPSIEKKAIHVPVEQLDCVLLKAFEETFHHFDLRYFEERLKRFKKQCGTGFESYSIYFPGVNLYVNNAQTGDHICHFRVASRIERWNDYGHAV